MNRQEAWDLVCEYTQSPQLRRHMQSVEVAMRAYARHFGEDEEKWGLVGLLHDFDYERYPDVAENGHPNVGAPILREHGLDEESVRAILSHATEVTGVERQSKMELTLFAVDELTGLIAAVALVRPSKDIRDVKVKSVRKKWKAKAFAPGVHREEIEQGAEALGVELNEHIQIVLTAMQEAAAELGLDGPES
ncbi:MAG: HDIG domain-containing protein [Anaerolineae bacterium]|nr:HDIG domain-containing protein [Anaerolineae bacterium]MCB0179541.1 HDIG domain-containing protein [Anaerolineae bacterium]MCB0227059.1 HDIG domain-containing protein [Anaerolineae bacterium]MCB9109523.1 HDIG domain-containing protein [Anaerolineales bacterium]